MTRANNGRQTLLLRIDVGAWYVFAVVSRRLRSAVGAGMTAYCIGGRNVGCRGTPMSQLAAPALFSHLCWSLIRSFLDGDLGCADRDVSAASLVESRRQGIHGDHTAAGPGRQELRV
jgi:hypothetical protein